MGFSIVTLLSQHHKVHAVDIAPEKVKKKLIKEFRLLRTNALRDFL